VNLQKTTFLNDQFHEIAVYDISIQRYKQKCAKIWKRIKGVKGLSYLLFWKSMHSKVGLSKHLPLPVPIKLSSNIVLYWRGSNEQILNSWTFIQLIVDTFVNEWMKWEGTVARSFPHQFFHFFLHFFHFFPLFSSSFMKCQSSNIKC